jgi:ribosomal protein S27E
MPEGWQYEENKKKGHFVQATCEECERETRHKIISSYDGHFDDPIYLSDLANKPDFYVNYTSSHQIIQCQGCMTISFRRTTWCDEPNEGEWISLFPERSHLTHFTKNFEQLPDRLYDIYEQTIACYNNHHLTLAAIGLRALLEGICAECGIEEGSVTDSNGNTKKKQNLQGKINGLYEKGLITKGNSEILHEHRFLGNEAAHQLKPPSRDDFVLAIEIIENLIETVFEIPHKGHKLKQKRDRTKPV